MSPRRLTNCIFVFTGVVLSGWAVQAQECAPTSDGLYCAPQVCSATAELGCFATALHLDAANGAYQVAACDCLAFDSCHLGVIDAMVIPGAFCPPGQVCEVFTTDTDGDGIEDLLTAGCMPAPFGACCVDIDDGPISYDTCIESDWAGCCANGGIFHRVNAACDGVQACCLSFGSNAYCVEMNPFCCRDSGGVPQGPNSTCVDPNGVTACPSPCGGIQGLPCDDTTHFCKLPEGGCCCDFMGVCTPRPDGCLATWWEPVCGCDGVTYGNPCEADAAGVSIAHRGGCGEPCNPDDSAVGCGEGRFCRFPDGACGAVNAPGMCAEIPTGCPDEVDPVCGCDGLTYSNRCEARAAAMSIAHHGPCEQPCSSDPGTMPCPDGFFCHHPDGACADQTQPGMCKPIPDECPAHWEPVCGCDGITYSNACAAAMAGVSIDCWGPCDDTCPDVWAPVCGVNGVTYPNACFAAFAGVCIAHHGECERSCSPLGPQPPCHDDEFCKFPEGTCEDPSIHGVCTPIPLSCPEIYDPVCGCNGVTYVNECEADAAQIPIAHQGACGLVCGVDSDCPAADQFCKFPEGTCGEDPDVGGRCVPVPNGCPDYWDPVCGCDGMTYGNECEADMARVSIGHRGECGVVCEPSSDGFGCTQAPCSVIPEVSCMPTVLHLEVTTGAIIVRECECLDFNVCHIEFGNASPFAVGHCPEGKACEVLAFDTNNDGVDDQFTAHCVPTGICCSDISGSPLPIPVCTETTESACSGGGVLWAGPGTACEPTEGCCLGPPGSRYCGDITPICCLFFDGTPLGPDSSCTSAGDPNTCPRVCGGIAGIPCEEGEFCRLNVGECCCDFQGICTPIPNNCTTEVNPVCGCDGVTYGNECLAHAAGVSIDHPGECGKVCGGFAGDTCADDEFCKYPEGVCNDAADNSGICTPVPYACPLYYDPVCGCNGMTYSNECYASMARMSVLHQGECEVGCAVDSDCLSPDQFCKFPEGNCGTDANVGGTCMPVPDGCDDVWGEPVCGCDGNTYVNECLSDMARVSVLHRGECGGVCEPSPDGLRCTPAPCSVIPEVSCMPTVLQLDMATGAIAVRDCECFDFNVCHIEFGDGGPIAVGHCPEGKACEVLAIDTDGDGLKDLFTAHCVATGVCCTDIGGIPLPYPVCRETTENVCHGDGVLFGGPGTTCEPFEACCLGPPGTKYCHNTNPMCCLFLGGTPLGPDSYCDEIADPAVCPRICGGIEGIPCGDDEFCRLNVGECCCDYRGVCTPIPDACPENWNPVCGCDGVTYGNECQAHAAGVSIDHLGQCEKACGGFTGDTCAEDEFCKYPPGICDDSTDHSGICTPVPDACPEIYEPVCGCDGMTYSNKCFANMARVSILHRGECEGGNCPANRVLTEPELSYCPGMTKTIHILLDPPAATTAIGLDDSPPAGWAVSNISDDGFFDPVNGKVKWGPLFAPFPSRVSYDVTPPADEQGMACFRGTISIDGINSPVCGDRCIDPCCPHLPADLPQTDCTECPGGDCGSCSDQPCKDGRVSLCEMISYACAWLRGCNDDLGGMTRAAYLWRNGECYCWDDAKQNWFLTPCDAAGSACCGAGNQIGDPGTGILTRTSTLQYATARVRYVSDGRYSRTREVKVPIAVEAPPGTSTMALEMRIPTGWKVTGMSNGGEWDDAHRKIKWGPFFGEVSRTVSFKARQIMERAFKTRGSSPDRTLIKFSGTVSFDGVNHPITVK